MSHNSADSVREANRGSSIRCSPQPPTNQRHEPRADRISIDREEAASPRAHPAYRRQALTQGDGIQPPHRRHSRRRSMNIIHSQRKPIAAVLRPYCRAQRVSYRDRRYAVIMRNSRMRRTALKLRSGTVCRRQQTSSLYEQRRYRLSGSGSISYGRCIP